MSETRVAKLFQNGASQAVRLPAEFRFEGKQVYATRDDLTGDVVLSLRPGLAAWRGFFELAESFAIPENYMAARPMNVIPVERELFHEDD